MSVSYNKIRPAQRTSGDPIWGAYFHDEDQYCTPYGALVFQLDDVDRELDREYSVDPVATRAGQSRWYTLAYRATSGSRGYGARILAMLVSIGERDAGIPAPLWHV